MSVQDYISSGIIEDYCLGLLSNEESQQVAEYASMMPDVKALIEEYENALARYAAENAAAIADRSREKILSTIRNITLENNAADSQLPLLNKYSSSENWLRIVQSVLPEKLENDMFVRSLRNENGVEQILIWTKVDYPDEVHSDEQECFIVLQGKCRCYIEDEVIELGPGGFLSIPMYKHHDVQVLEGPVLAVVQRVKVA